MFNFMNCCNKHVQTAPQLLNVSEMSNWNKVHFLSRRKVQICIVAVYFKKGKKEAFCSRDNNQSKKRCVNMGVGRIFNL